MFAPQPAQAAPEEHILKNPPLLELRQEPIPSQELLSAPMLGGFSGQGEKRYDLKIKYIEAQLRNPGRGENVYENVKLRGYVGTDTNPDTPYVGPTIEVNPGDTVRINLENNLPEVPGCKVSPEDINIPHCFNGTNLHTHGLWISPTGNSDNVLLSINPGEKFQYEFNIPPDHPAGTFWYHPHRHGSTVLQVASGMAGALIVRGDRKPEKFPFQTETPLYKHGDIDTLLAGLKEIEGNEMLERVLVFQQIPYACLDRNGKIKEKKEDGKVVAWVCDSSDTGGIEFYKDSKKNELFGPRTWEESGRYTSINGEVIPTITDAKAGQIERWRMIHAGIRNTISLEFRKLNGSAANFLQAADADRYISENCTGEPIPYFVIADDGLTRSQAWETELTTLQPGYRSDALVVFPEGGEYCVVDKAASAEATVGTEAESRQLLAVVNVQAEEDVTNFETYVKDKLVAAAKAAFANDFGVKSRVIRDLNNNLELSLFTPHPDITDAEVANTNGQELAFFIDVSRQPTRFEVSNVIGQYFNPKPYDPNRVDRELKLGDAEEWTLQSYFVGHPFHIHVNPFQIVKILDPAGKDVSDPNAIDDAGGKSDPQYPGLKGVWKDTLWIKTLMPGKSYPEGVYTVVARTRYQRYIGEFVLHCHILDHEDQGMMQNVSIVLPSGLSK
ncbi:MAG: multicopper oxidase family protein [Cyanobacteriota bacterium]|nr:multicopper oxidase family protein [Cyanobacteriota bacterium]